jgi:hypothetical protein
MGIRIRKIMGYGLADLHLDEEQQLADPRLRKNVQKSLNQPIMGYAEWLRALHEADPKNDMVADDRWRFPYREDGSKQLAKVEGKARDWITLLDGEEYSLTDGHGLILFQPYGFKDWYRYDDDMDYVQHSLQHDMEGDDALAPTVQYLPYNPYPHDGNYRRRDTGELIRSPWLTDMNRALHQGDDVIATFAAEKMGFASVADYQLNVYQAPPNNVIEFATWTGIFKDPTTARFLKPMLLTYWS